MKKPLRNKLLYVPAAIALTLISTSCNKAKTAEHQLYSDGSGPKIVSEHSQPSAQPQMLPQPPHKIPLEDIVFENVNVIERNLNPQSNKYVTVVLESHIRYPDGNINTEALRNQPTLYNTGTKLIESGFTNIFTESVMSGMTLRQLISAFTSINDSIDFSKLQQTSNPEDGKRLVQRLYTKQGVETSWLLALTYGSRVNFKGSESYESLVRQAQFSDLLIGLENILNSGLLDSMKSRYRKNTNDEEAKEFLLEFNTSVDYVVRNYDWFIWGRSKEMIDTILSGGNEGILFAGHNHFQSIASYLKSQNVNYMIICADCNPSSTIEFERKGREKIKELVKYKARLN